MNLSLKYSKVIALVCIICSSMVGEVLTYRTPWSTTGIIGGVIQIIGAMSIPLIGMIIGSSFIKDEGSFKDYYKWKVLKFIILYGIYLVILKVLTSGEYNYQGIVATTLGMVILAPFLKEFLKGLTEKKLSFLVIIIFIGSIVNVYFVMFGIDLAIDFTVFSNWLVFCIIGYAIPQVKSYAIKKAIYIMGAISVIFTFVVRAVPINVKLWEVSPTLILYSSAMFLLINNVKWTSIHRFSIVAKVIDFIEKNVVGIFLIHNYIIVYILQEKFNLSANRFKVLFGSAIVMIATLIIGGIMATIINKAAGKIHEKFIQHEEVLISKIKNINAYKHYLIWLMVGLVITFVAESLLREGMEYALDFVHFDNHKRFIANYLLVLAVTSPCILFKRSYLILGLISEVLIGFALASFLMYSFRGTPLTYSDFFAIQDGLAVAGEYVTMPLLVVVGILIGLILIINIGLSKYKVQKKVKGKKWAFIVVIAVVLYCKINLSYVLHKDILQPVAWDIKYSYNYNGFFFSLYDSYIGYKREKPELYNKENISAIREDLQEKVNNEFLLGKPLNDDEAINNENINSNENIEKKPNVIIVQLESVMDPLTIEGIELSGDPLENIRSISSKSTSGKFFVPTYGGGTARSEFEVLTGMSLDYFSQGELPHNTYLKKECIESIAYVLDSQIYEKTLIHNYQGSFYERNKAYRNLGFERYIPMEYMYNRQLEGEYPEDQLIYDNIIETLETTDKSDLIFAIAVQTHGGYNTEYNKVDSEIVVDGTLDSGYIKQLQDYVDDLVMVDRTVGQLVEYIDNLEEPTILAVYSDHLPFYDPIEQQYTQEEKYTTGYFIYDNMGFEEADEDIQAFELTTKIFKMLNLPGGVMNQFQNIYKEHEDYEKIMEYLQYDIVDGKKYIYNQQEPYSRTKMKMGIKDIIIEEAIISGNSIEVTGQNLNEYSCIYVDGKPIKTEYISKNRIRGQMSNNTGKTVRVYQLTRRDKPLDGSNEILIP